MSRYLTTDGGPVFSSSKSDARKTLADFTFSTKYARYLKHARRRENFPEAVRRMIAMHEKKFAGNSMVLHMLKAIEKSILNHKLLGSQRALQFGGEPIERKNMRMYNCAFSFADRPRFFAEAIWLLLCGSGVGFSVQKHHVARLPGIQRPLTTKKSVTIEDSIEGWADAFDHLINSYFNGTETVVFDYSAIRPAGSELSTGSGKAPGPQPLREALEQCRKLLNRCIEDGQTRLRPIDVYDIVMHGSGAVRAGGIRRSATICLFSVDDTEMINAKTGDWYKTNKQRARSNNSAVVHRSKATKEQFEDLFESIRQFGEPGFFFVNDEDEGTNPCVPAGTEILTREGYLPIDELVDKQVDVWNGFEWSEVTPAVTGHDQPLVNVTLSSGQSLVCTEYHEFVLSDGTRVKAKDLQNGMALIKTDMPVIGEGKVATRIFGRREVPIGYSLKDRIHWFDKIVSVDGKIRDDSSLFVSCDFEMSRKMQKMLTTMGVTSTAAYDGLSVCSSQIRKLHDLGIHTPQHSKKLRSRSDQSDDVVVTSVESAGEAATVYCFTEPKRNMGTFEGVVTGQCVEIGLKAYLEMLDGTRVSGWAMCNLTTANMGACETPDEFYQVVGQASVLGTLQASYVDTTYLGEVTKKILERDALLGVSLTGMADCPFAFDPEVLKKAAEIAVKTNVIVANSIGINSAARVTTVKPEGTGSLVLRAGNGIHPHHARRYIRNVQSSASDPIVKMIAKEIPEAISPCAWEASDVCVSFPIDLGNGELWLKEDTNPLDHLNKVKLVQENWVSPGKTRDTLTHNVSNTIVVGQDDWESVKEYLWENRASFGGVSLLGASGDLDYAQAPFVAYDGTGDRSAVQKQFDTLSSKWKDIDFSGVLEEEDATNLLDNVACAGGACIF